MSLERSVILSVIFVLFASLLVSAGLTYEHAVARVQAEMDAALAVGRRIVQNAADDDEGPFNPARRLSLIAGDFNGDRHLRAMVRDPAGNITVTSTLLQPDDPAPNLFFDLVSGPPITADVELPPKLRALGTLSIQTDAHNEVSEAWGDLKLTLLALGLFFCLVLALTVRILRFALQPLHALCDALARVGTGDYEGRLSWGNNYRELEELKHGFNGMVSQLAGMARENRLLQTRVQRVQEDERGELARDLHDEVAPFLFAVSADASLVRQHVADRNLVEIDARANGILNSVGHMQKHLRRVLSRLMPDVLLDLGLPGAIDALVHFWQSRKPDVAFTVDISEEMPDERSCAVAFRVVQESLNNAMRHANASRVDIAIQRASENFEVKITDNGQGLRDGMAQGLGLLGMRERVHALGGTLEIGNRQGQPGVIVRAVLKDATDAMALS